MVGAHIRLDGAHRGEVLLDYAVEMVHRGLELTVKRAHAHGDDGEDDGEHGQNHGKDRRELARQHEGVNKAHNQVDRAAHHGTEAVAHSVLNNGDVSGHARDERARLVFVEVAEGERLNLLILGGAQVSAETDGDAGGSA